MYGVVLMHMVLFIPTLPSTLHRAHGYLTGDTCCSIALHYRRGPAKVQHLSALASFGNESCRWLCCIDDAYANKLVTKA